jgi:hypothetical protein
MGMLAALASSFARPMRIVGEVARIILFPLALATFASSFFAGHSLTLLCHD